MAFLKSVHETETGCESIFTPILLLITINILHIENSAMVTMGAGDLLALFQ